MLGTYICNNLGFVAHYGLLGQWTAVGMNGLMAVQTIVALGLERWPRLRWVYAALMLVLIGTSILAGLGARHRSGCQCRARVSPARQVVREALAYE